MSKITSDGRVADVDLARYVRIFWKWSWLIILSVGIAAGSGYLATRSMAPSYTTSFTIMVGEDASNPNLTIDQVNTSQRLADAYAAAVRRQPVLEGTVDSLLLQTTWQELQSRVLVTRIPMSQLFEVRVVDSDPNRVKAIADEIARQLIILSPTDEFSEQLQLRRAFLKTQLNSLQADIHEAEAAIAQKQAELKEELSARAVLDRQDEIRALMLNLSGWRTTYASLLSSYQGRSPNTLSVIETPFVPEQASGPDVRANVLMAAALGLLLAMAAALLIEYVSDTIGTTKDVSRVLSLPVLGEVPRIQTGKIHSALISDRALTDPLAEIYRLIQGNARFLHQARAEGGSNQAAQVDGDPSKESNDEQDGLALLVTSAGTGEGKSLTAANLAISFAQAGQRTVLVDCDLRQPTLHSQLGVANERGLTQLFLDPSDGPRDGLWWRIPDTRVRAERPVSSTRTYRGLPRRVRDSLLPTQAQGLYLLPAGPVPANPAGIFESPKMERILAYLRTIADVIVFDSPPVLPVVDTAVLAGKVDGVILVALAGKTRSSAIHEAKQRLVRADASLIGVVLNGVHRSRTGPYYSYYADGNRNGHAVVDSGSAAARRIPQSLAMSSLVDAARRLVPARFTRNGDG